MLKKMRLLLLFAFALIGVLLLPSVSFASPLPASAQKSDTFAFTGLTDPGTGSGAAITGGLLFTVGQNGYFHGRLYQSNGTQLSVSGQVTRNGGISLAFYSIQGLALLRGQGHLATLDNYTGTFQVYSNGSQIASGIWSALAFTPSKSFNYAFSSAVVSGKDQGTITTGALVLNRSSLKGYLLEADGTRIRAQAWLSHGGKNIKLSIGKPLFTGAGERAKAAQIGTDKGYLGQCTGPDVTDTGTWSAFFFLS